jgi:hypothetical protein
MVWYDSFAAVLVIAIAMVALLNAAGAIARMID